MPDHLHLFVGLNPNQSISDLIRIVKSDSSEWINRGKLTRNKFQWQQGYGAFSHSRSQVDKVVNYIANQQEHHKKKTFLDEYQQILKDFNIEFDERYIFQIARIERFISGAPMEL
jgi:putative transposase